MKPWPDVRQNSLALESVLTVLFHLMELFSTAINFICTGSVLVHIASSLIPARAPEPNTK